MPLRLVKGTARTGSKRSTVPPLTNYLRFGAMILTSTVVMYLLTYTNTYVFAHARFSETRVYMALLMGAAMAIIMLAFMWSMHRSHRDEHLDHRRRCDPCPSRGRPRTHASAGSGPLVHAGDDPASLDRDPYERERRYQ